MSNPKQLLADQLAAAVAPHFGGAADAARPPKGVAKTLRQLAKQLTRQQGKQAKAVEKPTPLTAKRARKALAGDLAQALHPHLVSDDPSAKAPKAVTKAVKRLAAQLVKQRRKQAKQNAKNAKQDAKQTTKTAQHTDSAADLPAAQATRRPASSAAPTTRRPAAAPTKRPTAKAAAAKPASSPTEEAPTA